MPLHIVSIGECTVDEYSDLRTERFGGISLNFAVHAKRCGADVVSLLSCAGEDYGFEIRARLLNEGIDVSRFAIATGKTARQKILLKENGERIFPAGGYDPGVLVSMNLNEEDARLITTHNVLVSACFKQVESLFRQAMQIPFDGWRVADFLDLADFNGDPQIMFKYELTIAFVSGNKTLAEQLQHRSKQTECVIVVTLGAEGSFAFLNGDSFYQPSLQVQNLVDSTGCGDAFQAAFTVSYSRNRNLQTALQCGARQAASVIQQLGAI